MARKILLADDSVTAQNMGRKILADAGYEVITVNNGSAALKKIAETKPDLIVLDVYMPGYSGLEVCQRLKEAGETARIPVLLTVGKLEPFKPEEAKRVRAEGFIVKPFEASELLSALTKLEDKMVPRSESSKPGRFARAIAAVEEGRYDKSAAAEEDSGWKNRISFPSKKKRKTEEPEDGDDPAIYNAVNKDLRTVVEHKPAPQPETAKADHDHVDLAALAPEGLPKDVTPGEIAALAAAAAQIQGKVAETKTAAIVTGEREPAPAAHPESHDEKKPEQVEQAPPVSESPAEVVASASSSTEPIQESKVAPEISGNGPQVYASMTAAVTQAAPMEPVTSAIAMTPASGNGFGSAEPAAHAEPEPVTMALAAGAERAFGGTRWTAVAVALAPEEVAANLEEEMRTATAALADLPPAMAEGSLPVPSDQPVGTEPPHSLEAPVSQETAPPVAAPAQPEIEQAITAAPPEQVPTLQPAENQPNEIHPAVRNFETVSAPPVESPSSPSEANSGPTPVAESTVPTQESKLEEASLSEPVEPAPAEMASPAQDEPVNTEPVQDSQPVTQAEEMVPIDSAVAASEVESQAPAEIASPAASEAASVSDTPAEGMAATASAVSSESAEEAPVGKKETGSKESDIAATTAAAWASWRRIRESGDPTHPGSHDTSPEEAAMAVAAGAEKAPEEGPEIESIVDSVLADLRPKIVEEISKKLKKKK